MNSKEAVVTAVCISERKGEQKHPVEEVELKVDWGIVGDAHAGNWHRQVSVLGCDSVRTLQEKLPDYKLEPGAFAENVLVDGITVYRLPVGTRLALGETAEAEVTQIGKQCHNDCVVVKIVKPGFLKAGDTVRVIGESENRANNSRKY